MRVFFPSCSTAPTADEVSLYFGMRCFVKDYGSLRYKGRLGTFLKVEAVFY